MFASARKAVRVIFDPTFRGVVLKSLLLTLVLFAALFFGAQYGLAHLPQFHWHWLNVAVDWLGSLLVIVGLFFLGAPVAALFASLFLDEIAEAVEKSHYPADPPSSGTPFWAGLIAGLRLSFWVVFWTLVLLPFNFFLPGLGYGGDDCRQWLAVGPRIFRAGGAAPYVAIGGAGAAGGATHSACGAAGCFWRRCRPFRSSISSPPCSGRP